MLSYGLNVFLKDIHFSVRHGDLPSLCQRHYDEPLLTLSGDDIAPQEIGGQIDSYHLAEPS